MQFYNQLPGKQENGQQWEDKVRISLFHERFQPRQRLVPLPRNTIERASRFIQPHGLKLKKIFTSSANAANQPGLLENSKMLSDRLSREHRALGKTSDREWRASAELREQVQPRFVSQRGEYRCASAHFPNRTIAAFL
jgi:hypothetical protein